MSTGKVVLIVGGVAVGAYVLLKLVAPSPLSRSATGPRSGTDLVGGINGIIGAATSLKGLFSSNSSSAAASAIDNPRAFEGGAYADPASQAALSKFDTDNYSASGGFMFTDTSGTFIAG